MPFAKFIRVSKIVDTFRTSSIKGQFDIPNMEEVKIEFNVNLPCEDKEWNIGLIVGSSGSGKTTIAKECFKDFFFFSGFKWDKPNLIDDFPKECSVNDIVEALSSAGLVSAPDYLKPFGVLSNGQKMRAEIARLFLEKIDQPIIYDEFTSVVDRQVAQVTSYVISKYIRKKQKQFIALSCHRDIVEWLNPDWIFDTDTNKFSWRSPTTRPKLEVKIRHATNDEWHLFERFHYLSKTHNKTAVKFLAEINGVPVAWCSILPLVGRAGKGIRRIHRLVVRGDYQGLGLGHILMNFVGDYCYKHSLKLTINTSLKYFVQSLSKDKNWLLFKKGYRSGGNRGKFSSLKNTVSYDRLTASFKYVSKVS